VLDGAANVKGNYVFNRVFDSAHDQAAVYEGTAKPYVQDFVNGKNVTLFAYGQTGTGKTHTIAGPKSDPGLITRCLEDIFSALGNSQGKQLHFEYVQLYMQDFKDLLLDEQKAAAVPLKLQEHPKDGVQIAGLTRLQGTSVAQVLQALEEAAPRRAVRAQGMNEVSSRSHAMLILRLIDGSTMTSMFIVDLAGSERIARSGVSGDGFDEATSINQSLTALGRVVMSLVDGSKFIPYTGSPLTMALKSGLGGNSKTALIACVTQASDSLSESVSTLRFAMQASHVKNKVAGDEASKKVADAKKAIAANAKAVDVSDGKGCLKLGLGEVHFLGDVAAGAEAPFVLFLHDDTKDVTPELWAKCGQVLAAKGWRWMAPFLPGFGPTPGKKGSLKADGVVTKDGPVDIARAILDHVGVETAHIVARENSLFWAVHLLKSVPTRIGRVVLMQVKPVDLSLGDTFCALMNQADPKKDKAAAALAKKAGGVGLFWAAENRGKPDPDFKASGGVMAKRLEKKFGSALCNVFKKKDEELWNLTHCFLDTGKLAPA
jgi:hypothetical protein